MRRPALSATRAFEILDRLAADPRRAFSMSEIMRDTGINVASCHSVLNVMTERGYLQRCPVQKTYRLGPVLAAAGQTSFLAQPLIGRARVEAKSLVERVGHNVLLTATVADEIVAIFTLGDNDGAVLRVGQRVPLAPPLGAPFVAWAPDEVVEGWLARLGDVGEDVLDDWRRSLALVRQRGYQVTLRAPDPELSRVMSEIALGRAPRTAQRDWSRFFELGDRRLLQPATIAADTAYHIVLIAAPLFDAASGTTYCLSITNFPNEVLGSDIERLAQELLQSCMRIMRE